MSKHEQPDEQLAPEFTQAPETHDEDLSALEMPAAAPVPLDVRDIPLDDIGLRRNTRPVYGIEKLAETMHLEGQLQPAVVRPAAADAEHGKPFELIFGHRRKAAVEYLRERGLGVKTLRCEVREVPDDERLVQMIIENYQREELSAVAEAYAMAALKDEKGWSQSQIARALGCDPSHVSHRLGLLKLALPEAPGDEQPDVTPTGDTSEAKAKAPRELPAASADDKPRVDILSLVDRGKLSASAAEVIGSLDKRDEQEKVASLATRYDWSVKQVEKYARKLKTQELDMGPEEMGPVEMVIAEDMVDLPRLQLKPEITDSEYERINLLALLRNGMDQEMLEYLQEVMGWSYDYLWAYVSELSDEQVTELTRTLLRRYLSAAHRRHDWPPELIDQFELPAGASDKDQQRSLKAAQLALPGALEPQPLPEAQE